MYKPVILSGMETTSEKANSQNEKYNVKIVERCLEIFDLATQIDGPISIQAVCTALNINSNMAYRLLTTMTSSAYLEKDEATGQYSVSIKVLQLARKSLMSLEIRRMAMPYLEMLWKQFPKANVNLGLFSADDVIVIDRIDSLNLPRTYFTPGKTLPFHATGLGEILPANYRKRNSMR